MPKNPITPAARRHRGPKRDHALSPALPRQGRTVAAPRPVKVRKTATGRNRPAKHTALPKAAPPTRRRTNQETIDEMAALRRQGVSFREIGAQLGCSERTARRYVGRVLPQLHLPQASPALETDPRALRDRLLSEFIDLLYAEPRLRSLTVMWHRVDDSTSEAEYGGPPSILFLSEAERLLQERLDSIGLLALRLLAKDRRSKLRFMREVVGFLYWDYVGWHQFAQNFGSGDLETGEDWRPPAERPPVKELDYIDPYGLDT